MGRSFLLSAAASPVTREASPFPVKNLASRIRIMLSAYAPRKPSKPGLKEDATKPGSRPPNLGSDPATATVTGSPTSGRMMRPTREEAGLPARSLLCGAHHGFPAGRTEARLTSMPAKAGSRSAASWPGQWRAFWMEEGSHRGLRTHSPPRRGSGLPGGSCGPCRAAPSSPSNSATAVLPGCPDAGCFFHLLHPPGEHQGCRPKPTNGGVADMVAAYSSMIGLKSRS